LARPFFAALIHDSTRFAASSSIIGPMKVFSLRGSPIFSFATAALSLRRNFS